MLDERRVASVQAEEICDMYVLKKRDFNEVLSEYPRMKKTLEHIALERLENLNTASDVGNV